MQCHLFPTNSWFIIFLIIIFVHAPSSAFADDDERYLSCMKLYDRGNIKGVGYPFSGYDRPDYCGYPEFELDYTENLCPTLLFNTSLNPNLLSSTSDHAEVTLYYGCPSPSPPGFSAQFTCNINDTGMMGYFIIVNLSVLSMTAPSLLSYLTACNNGVKVPAHLSAIMPILLDPTVAQLLEAINELECK
ncbi:hypothetical protein POTOM_055284 [Populus tomentosa]|uniref:Uncharacterized protein n=1 Tax=Populus tomentosa TaxID=118781 RepID=A0A8X7Y332_POPTO|nr:hypothetical protein POTOM_055284 [Populus tomentosa]